MCQLCQAIHCDMLNLVNVTSVHGRVCITHGFRITVEDRTLGALCGAPFQIDNMRDVFSPHLMS